MTRRLLLSYLALTLAVLAALELPLAYNFEDRLRSDLTNDLQRDAFAVASFSEETVEAVQDPTSPHAQAATPLADLPLLANTYASRTGARIVIVDTSGKPLADSNPTSENENFSSREEIKAALLGQVSQGVRHSDTLDTDLLYVAVPIASGKVYGAVRITFSMDQLQDRVRRYWLDLGLIAGVSLLAAAGIGVALARWVARPLEQVREAATALGAGDLAARSPEDAGPPEVRELASSFNRTADRLEDLVTAQDQFVADASHQLRTPLAALRLRLENVQERVSAQQGLLEELGANDPDLTRDLDAALGESDRLARLVEGLLLLARAERSDTAADREVLPLDSVLAERAELWVTLAAPRQVELVVRGDGLVVLAHRDRLSQVLDNLVANALDASPAGARIHVFARTEGAGGSAVRADRVEIHVTDQGPGMTEEQRAHAFDRFWRSERDGRQRANSLGGSGLGLSIVRKLARADGGDVALNEAPSGGLDAVLFLDRAPG